MSCRSRRWFSFIGFVLAACGTLIKPPDPDRRLNVRMTGTLFDSDRGYRFAALPEAGSRVVSLHVRYPVGSADDPPGKEGLAHLVEHLLTEVEITRSDAKTSISAEMNRLALTWNASTTNDYTTYEVLAAPEALGDLLRLEVERLSVGCAGLTRELVAREREVVINELRERQGASGADTTRLILEAVYPAGHPYRTIATVETVGKLQLEDVCAFLVGPYRQGRALVVASGAVDGEALKTAAGTHLARAPQRVGSPRAAAAVAPHQPGKLRLRADVDEPALLATWPLPPRSTRDYRLLQMAAQYIAPRLEGFAFTYGWGNSANWWIVGGNHAPVLVVAINLRSVGDANEAISAAGKAAEFSARVVHRPGDTRESAGWVRQWEHQAASLLARWDSLGGRNNMFADFLHFETDASLTGRLEELTAAAPREPRDLAEHWLSPKRARYLVIEPTGTSSVARAGLYSGGAESHVTRVDGALADRPLVIPRSTHKLLNERYKMRTGLTVVLAPDGTAPLVHGRLVIDSGAAHDPTGKEGIAHLVGASSVYSDSMVFDARNLSIRVDDQIRYLASELRVAGYGFSDEEKKQLKKRLVQKRAKERTAYQRDMLVAVYGEGHPYARAAMTEESIGNLSHDIVTKWARNHLVPKNATLILAGKFDAKLVKRHLAYAADQVPSGSDSADHDAPARPRRQWIIGTTDKPSPTVAINVSFTGGRGIDRDHARRLVLEQVLNSQFAKLRAQQALTYGFYADFSPRRSGGLWSISGDVDAKRSVEAATAIVAILAEIRRDPESYRAAFVLGRQKVVEALLVGARSSAAVADRLALVARFDLGDDFHDRLVEDVASVTLTTFHGFLTKELDLQGQVFGAFGNVGPASAAVSAARQSKADAASPSR